MKQWWEQCLTAGGSDGMKGEEMEKAICIALGFC